MSGLHLADEPGLPPVMWDVVEELFDELGFFCRQLARQLHDPLLRLADVEGGIERRLRAALDALVIEGPDVCGRLLATHLENVDPERPAQTEAMVLLLTALQRMADAAPLLAHDDASIRAAVVAGLTRAGDERVGTWAVQALRQASDPRGVAALLNVIARLGTAFDATPWLTHDAPDVLAAALGTALNEGPTQRTALERALHHDAPAVRQAALPLAVAWGLPSALERTTEPASWLAVALHGTPRAWNALRLPDDPAQRALVFRAWGATGSAEWLPRLRSFIEAQHPLDARHAAQAVVAITGLDLRVDALVEPSPEPVDDLAPEYAWPFPHAVEVQRWLDGHPKRSGRSVLGRPRTETTLREAIETGPVGLNDLWALALTFETRGRVRLDVEAWPSTQRAALAASKTS